jgi:hypothetical protein
LPPALARLRRKLGAGDEADRRFVRVLAAVLEDGVECPSSEHLAQSGARISGALASSGG